MRVYACERCVPGVPTARYLRARGVKSRAAGSPAYLRLARSTVAAGARGPWDPFLCALGFGEKRCVWDAGLDDTWWRNERFGQRNNDKRPCSLGQVFLVENSPQETVF